MWEITHNCNQILYVYLFYLWSTFFFFHLYAFQSIDWWSLRFGWAIAMNRNVVCFADAITEFPFCCSGYFGRYPTHRRRRVVFSSIAWLSTPWAYKICAEIVLAKGSVLQTVAWLASVRLPMPMIHDVASQFRHSPAQYTRKQMFYSCFHSWNATIFLGDNSTSNMDICNNDVIDALQICLSVASAFSKLWGFRSSKYRRLWVCLLQCTTPMSTSND